MPTCPLILYPSSFILRRASRRRGLSLIEVLISVFVLSIGLIGLAALLPVGRLAIAQTGKSDRAGACGRAGLYIVKTCRMLDSQKWANNTADSSGASFIVDPLGCLSTSKLPSQSTFGASSGTVSRITLKGITDSQAQQFFSLQDDLTFTPPNGPGRPIGSVDSTTNQLTHDGNYSWFFTVTPAPAEVNMPTKDATGNAPLKHYTVSIVVCYKRDLSTGNGENTATTVSTNGDPTCGYVTVSNFSQKDGNGNVMPFDVRENDWIALCGTTSTVSSGPVICRWYRVVSVANSSSGTPTQFLSLSGPDCSDFTPTAAVSIGKSVVGVYTEPVQVDRDLLW